MGPGYLNLRPLILLNSMKTRTLLYLSNPTQPSSSDKQSVHVSAGHIQHISSSQYRQHIPLHGRPGVVHLRTSGALHLDRHRLLFISRGRTPGSYRQVKPINPVSCSTIIPHVRGPSLYWCEAFTCSQCHGHHEELSALFGNLGLNRELPTSSKMHVLS